MTTLTIGENADRLNKVKQLKAKLNEEIKELNKEIFTIEIELQNELQAIGLDKFSTKQVAITMTSADVPNIENLEEFYNYIIENRAPYLLQRRPSAAAMAEIWNSGQEIKGVSKVNKVTIRTKKL